MESRKEMTQQHAKEELRTKLKFIRYVVVLAVVLILLFSLYYFRDDLNIDNIKRSLVSVDINFRSGGKVSKSIAIDPSYKWAVVPFKNSFAMASNGTVKVFDRSGELFLNSGISILEPTAQSSKNFILVFDRGGTNLYIYNTFSLVFKKEFTSGIINAKINDDGSFVVVSQEQGYKAKVTVFSSKHEEIYAIYFSERFVADVALSKTMSNLAVLLISESGGEVVSTVEFYEFNKKTSVSSKDYKDDMIIRLDYRSNGKLLAVSSNFISMLTKSCEETAKIELEDGSLIAFSDAPDNYFVVLSGYNNGIANKLLLYDNNCKNVGTMSINDNVSMLSASNKYIGILSNDKVLIITPNNMKIIKETTEMVGIKKIFFASDHVPYIINNDEIRMIDIS